MTNIEGRILDEEDSRHIHEHRCCMSTKPPWDLCDELGCIGDRKNGSNTWLQIVYDMDLNESKSLCWTCPVMEQMYPNVRKCDYFKNKYDIK